MKEQKIKTRKQFAKFVYKYKEATEKVTEVIFHHLSN